VLVAGGGIGGLAAALALARQGYAVKVLEQAASIGEIGAGIQLGPNAFSAFDALGIGERARERAVYTDRIVMMDAVDESEVASMPVGDEFRKRFGNPYAVSHRADVHGALLEGARRDGHIELATSTRIDRVERDGAGVRAIDGEGGRHEGTALIGCDGVKSSVRQQLVGDPVRVSGHVVYRAVVDTRDFPADLKWNAPCVWAGPDCHLVHYPGCAAEQYNVVVTFHSRKPEEWGVTEGAARRYSRTSTASATGRASSSIFRKLEALGHGGSRAHREMELRAGHAPRRRGPSHDAISRPGRLHGDGGRGHARGSGARERRRLRGCLRAL
jgi:salicylate hydroxylase